MTERPRFQMVSDDGPVCEDGVCAVPGPEAPSVSDQAESSPTP